MSLVVPYNLADLSLSTSLNKTLFRKALLNWYQQQRRDLPWRRDRDPYHVWLSEIMLQQTRVAAVIAHYERFLQRFPTVRKLAAAREPSVLAAWSGLGYYRRARMMHVGAKKIVKDYGGSFPPNAESLREIPGIGRYTAAAIASIAFGEPVAVVDGNVERVLQRLAGQVLQKEEQWAQAQDLLDAEYPGDFNQAVMELGATVCTPRQPKCMFCPVAEFCATRGELPQALNATPQNKREIHYALHRENGSVWLVQRAADASLMPRMWELPEVSASSGRLAFSVKHSITVTDYTVRVLEPEKLECKKGRWVAKKRLSMMPLTGLAKKILRTAKVI
jgi:A/G-specific adenine glycosylase